MVVGQIMVERQFPYLCHLFIIIEMNLFGRSKTFQTIQANTQIQPLIYEITTNSTTPSPESFFRLFTYYFGSTDSPGLLQSFGLKYANYRPMEWAAELQKILQHISPSSQLFERIQKSKDIRITLNASYLPHGVDAKTLQNENIHLEIRTTYQGFSLPVLDCFYFMLAHAIYKSQPINVPISQYEQLTEDELYASLSRNPLLTLLRRHAQALNPSSKGQIKKIIGSMRVYLINQVLGKYEMDRARHSFENPSMRGSMRIAESLGGRKQIQLKQKLKVHHVHALMLLMSFAPEYFNDFPKLCLAYLQYFSFLSGEPNCLQALIRAWIFSASLKKRSNIQFNIIKVLQKANPSDGWYALKRQSPNQISSVDNIGDLNIQVAQSFLRTFERQGTWIPNLSFLNSFACFFRFLSTAKVYYPEFITNHRSIITDVKDCTFEQNGMKKIFILFNQNIVDIYRQLKKSHKENMPQITNFITEMEEIIEKYATQFMDSKTSRKNVAINKYGLEFRKVNEVDILASERDSKIISRDGFQNVTIENKRHLVSFYRRQPSQVWRAPVQSNEWLVLYYFWLAVANLLESILPGKREFPRVNLRFLANPINFFGLLCLLLAIRYIFF